MARYWSETDASGNKLTDGRMCLVIEPDDKSLPKIYTYGMSKEEVLEKMATTAETGQATIHKLRSQPAAVTPAAPAPAASTTVDELARATADLSNPAKSAAAIKTLLKHSGVDVEKIQSDEAAKRVQVVAQEWEKNNPEFPSDERNQRLLINTAALKVGFYNINAAALDAAYEYMEQHQMLFAAPEVQPDGNRDTRTPVRTATTYRRNALRGQEPSVTAPKPKYTREAIDKLNSKELREKIENEPGFREWFNKEFAAKSA